MLKRLGKWRRSIAFRYLAIASICLIVTQFCFGMLQVHQQYRLQLTSLEKRAEGQAEFLSAVSPEAILNLDFLTLERLMKQASIDENIVYAVVTNNQDRPLTRSLNRNNIWVARAISQSRASDAIAPASNPKDILSVLQHLKQNAAIQEIRRPIASGGEVLGELHLGYAFVNLWSELVRGTTAILIASIIKVLLLAILTTLLFDREVRRPLNELANLAKALASGHFDRRANMNRKDEIGRLNIAFNRMAGQLQLTLQQLAEANQALELKVEERTASLAATNQKLEREVRDRAIAETKLQQTLNKLTQTQSQLIQSEKMSALGELVGGIAHEINNPINFIHGNLIHARNYSQELLYLIDLYQEEYPNPSTTIQSEIDNLDLDFLREDLNKVLNSMQSGTQRIRQIVLSLRNFSRLDESELKEVDIHEGIESTLMILHSRLKAKSNRPAIEIILDYAQLPKVLCYPGQLNQVFMNLLSNAIDSLEEQSHKTSKSPPTITIQTRQKNKQTVSIHISDNGIGIPDSIQPRIFDPFFTTKDVGKGTGLGLSISYQIIVEQHKGVLSCITSPGKGATFVLEIPMQ
ncbi:sensor histidine kinase [Lusitaniella coriacea]|uniref:sensor histidine kinase n=1 Tax=Lusitaniella coriacea TaxID=1983105 RepID=UPI003CF889FA